MQTIEWILQMNLGIPELDLPRRTLVEIVSRIEDAMHAQADQDELATMLRRFCHVARAYLDLEQSYLLLWEPVDSLRCSRDDNVQQICRDIVDGMCDYLNNGKCIDEELLGKLKTWLLEHFKSGEILKSPPPGQASVPRPDHSIVSTV